MVDLDLAGDVEVVSRSNRGHGDDELVRRGGESVDGRERREVACEENRATRRFIYTSESVRQGLDESMYRWTRAGKDRLAEMLDRSLDTVIDDTGSTPGVLEVRIPAGVCELLLSTPDPVPSPS